MQSPIRVAQDMASAVLRASGGFCTPAALWMLYCDRWPRRLNLMAIAAGIPAAREPLAEAFEAVARPDRQNLQIVYVSDIMREQRSHAVPAGLGPMKRSLE